MGDFKRTKTTSKGAVSSVRGMSSMGKIFAERGDPQMTIKEAMKTFGVNPLTDNPDRDRYIAAEKALFKPKYVDPPQKNPVVDKARRLANIARKMHSKMNGRTIKK